MKILPIILLVHLATLPLFCQEKPDFKNDESISNSFTTLEIEGLESMVRYVDNNVTNGENELNIDDAYHQFLKL